MERLTREQVRAYDRHVIRDLRLPGIVLMENAARGLLDECWGMLPPDLHSKRVAVVCGGGNNGGDGYALARHLMNAYADVRLFAAKPVDELRGDAGVNANVCRNLGLPVLPAIGAGFTDYDLVVDCLLGTGLATPPRQEAKRVIRAINAARVPVLACDVPSGLDCDSGRPFDADACVHADRTVTFVAEKAGFPRAREWTGEVHVVGVGVRPASFSG